MKRLMKMLALFGFVSAAFLAGSPRAVQAVCEGFRETYWACTGECTPGAINILSCEEYRCSDDSPTGRRTMLITNICS
jgi:hypothetical protein